MKAIRFHQHGGPEVLRYEDAPTPEPGPGEVLVALRAAALNHLDLFTRKGDVPKVPLPHIGGADGAGVVAANGPGATRYPAGTRVFFDPGLSDGTCDYCARGEHSLCDRWEILGEHRDGTYAQAVVIPEVTLRPIPEGLSFEEAAAFPLVFLTAWRMVVTKARVLPGETVLILGIGGGVALAALQIAKHAGGRVFVTSSSDEKLDRAKTLGADVLINHKRSDFSKEVWTITEKRGVDVVIEDVGAATWPGSIRALARGGRLVTCGATSGPPRHTATPGRTSSPTPPPTPTPRPPPPNLPGAAWIKVPGGFSAYLYARNMGTTTAMAFGPDGRLYVVTAGGSVMVVPSA